MDRTLGSDLVARTSGADFLRKAFLVSYSNENTRRGYAMALDKWWAFCSEASLDPLDAERHHLELFARVLEQTLAKATVGHVLTAVAGFYKCAVVDSILDRDPMLHVRRPKVARVTTTNALTRGELVACLQVAERSSPRTYALWMLLSHNGLRISEALNIDVEGLFVSRKITCTEVTRKGGKRDLVPFEPGVDWALERIVDGRRSGPLFVTSTGARLTRNQAGADVRRVARKAGITRRISPHSLRHTFCTLLLDSGVSERDVQRAGGWSDLRMVSFYDHGRTTIRSHATFRIGSFIAEAA